ncbi:unnamed protein product [Spirodela intermedia]|uniref:Uncharacterized protein n=1 Tax=Spirodela intermedia TaxID=51605 RepID=A0A7I8IFB8_SPIIN|nr:unnamed protein product [Spirodela intermedia]CAA6656487.1 unnamed protein product [Spirodela intermedia]
MNSQLRTRGRPRKGSLGLSSVPSIRLPSAASPPVVRWSAIPGRMAAPWVCLCYRRFVIFSPSSPFGEFSARGTAVYSIEVVKEYHHDPDAFTQGLLYAGNDTLFESTGLYGHSSVRKVLLQTGKVKIIHRMDSSFFGEGLTLLGERLYQVAWRTRTGFIYDKHSLKKVKKFTHQMDDGWGLATDGKVIFGSDGGSTLYQLEPQSLKVIKSTVVKYNGQAVFDLNELEFIDGEVWANVWQTDCIARISHEDGKVLGWILLHGLSLKFFMIPLAVVGGNLSSFGWRQEIDVLNGIAWDQENGRIFVTGKLWPKLYEIKLRELTGPLNGTVEDICRLRLF